jgi:hypothetical protein
VVAGIFEAAAALTFGSFGIQPVLVPAITFLLYFMLQVALGANFPGHGRVWHMLLPFVIVVVWAIVSSFLMPWWFEGRAYVWPQKSLPPFIIAALAPNAANLNQDFYLIMNCLLTIIMSCFFASRQMPLVAYLQAYLLSGVISGLIAVWQFANRIAGIPFPDSLFYSNPGWAILTEQSLGAVPRINGTFSEPSALASYMGEVVFATGWLLLRGNRDWPIKALFIFSLLIMFLSTSTTGFAMLAIAAFGVVILAVMTRSEKMIASIWKISLPLVAIGVGVAIFAGIFMSDLSKNIQDVYNITINKQQSSSYEERTGADLDSLIATLDTYGLGVGWGSNRSSSLLPGLLAAVGVPGVCGLLWFAIKIGWQVRSTYKVASDSQRFVIDGCCGAVVGFLLSGFISGPTITSVTFFYLLSLLIGSLCQVSLLKSGMP